VLDDTTCALKSALLDISKTRKAGFVFTANQNVTLTRIAQADKELIAGILDRYGVSLATETVGALRRDAIACVAFNTCPLALAEAQRYLPTFISRLEPLLTKYGLQDDAISIRMTGCPNGCGRPYLAEIGLIGTAYGKYNLHLGGDRLGERLNTKYKESLEETQLLEDLEGLLGNYSLEKIAGETFGDFITRTKVV
jgi:sulfite reductase (NADPH) hemoprotein beta-component